jgi:hypothetical protein
VGWHGPYYYRSRREGSRVVREYLGTGRVAELAAQMHAIKRADREAEKADREAEKAELAALEGDIEALIEKTDLLTRAALLAAGFHQHKRGEWRKKRGNCKSAEPHGSDRPEGAPEAGGACPARG